MKELGKMNTRKRPRKDKEIPDMELKPKNPRLVAEAKSDSNGICIIVDIYLLNFIS